MAGMADSKTWKATELIHPTQERANVLAQITHLVNDTRCVYACCARLLSLLLPACLRGRAGGSKSAWGQGAGWLVCDNTHALRPGSSSASWRSRQPAAQRGRGNCPAARV